MNKLNALFSVNNQTALLILLGVLVAFVVLLTTLGIVFIIALRKRRPIVKVVMTPEAQQREEEAAAKAAAAADSGSVALAEMMMATGPASQQAMSDIAHEPANAPRTVAPAGYAENTVAPQAKVINKQITEGYLVPVYMITAYENVYYSFSPYEISSQPHEKYSAIRNNIQTYEKVKERTSGKREGYRVGRVTASSGVKKRVKQKKGIRIATVKRKSV